MNNTLLEETLKLYEQEAQEKDREIQRLSDLVLEYEQEISKKCEKQIQQLRNDLSNERSKNQSLQEQLKKILAQKILL